MAALVALLACAALVAAPEPIRAADEKPRTAVPATPWRPPAVDSLKLWADEGLALLAPAKSDTVGPTELAAFDHFDHVARKYFGALGSRSMRGARGVLTVLDSLGVKADFAQDAELPQFCALTFFNPAFDGYAAVTYLYWWRGDELRHQRMLLTGGKRMQLEVWWTGKSEAPYEAGFIDHRRTGETREPFFTLLRMSPRADFWGIVQAGRRDLDLGGRGNARFVDLNDDAVPELLAWVVSPPDARFRPGPELPPLLSERIWQRSDSGFVVLDRRTLPSPFATFVLFLRALETTQTTLARELVTTPAVLTKARTLKLGTFKEPESWETLGQGAGGPWRQRMRFQYGTAARRDKMIDVQMKFVDGRWLIERLDAPANLKPAKPAPAPSGAGGAR